MQRNAAVNQPLEGVGVLIVDDNDSLRAAMRRFLEDAGCAVVDAGGPTAGVEAARAYPERLDVALVDLVLPEMSGPECAELLLEDHPDLIIIYVSGYAEAVSNGEPGDKATPLLIQKPFARNELVDAIRRAMGE